MLLWTIVFALQLAISSVSHEHDFADDVADCVSCQVASNGALTLPDALPQLLAVLLVLAYLIARQRRYVSVIARRYLIPSRQAPPIHFSL